jgi:transglutaminase-like putative cysteine protease
VSGAGEPWEVIVDGEGRTVELRIGPMVIRRTAAHEVRLPRMAPVISNRFLTDRIPRLEGVRSMTVEAVVAEDVSEDVFPASIYGSVSRSGGGKLVLSLREVRPDGRIPREELAPDDRERFLAPSNLVECDEPEILLLACKIVRGDCDALKRSIRERRRAETGRRGLPLPTIKGGEEEPLRQALLVTRWVRRGLSQTNRGPATASALEALRARSGDCTEHASLTTALLRALGLPARQAMGLVHDGSGFQFHAWAEVYVRDRWVPLDPTLGRVGVPAIYVLLGREGDLIEYHNRANALQGRTSMRIVEVN